MYRQIGRFNMNCTEWFTQIIYLQLSFDSVNDAKLIDGFPDYQSHRYYNTT